MEQEIVNNWGVDWAWGLPLIVVTVLIHAYGLGFIGKEVMATLRGGGRLRSLSAASVFATGGTALSATILHAIEGLIWASAYRLLGALLDFKSAMLYSLNAMTSYG